MMNDLNQTIKQLFENQCQFTPDRLAIADSGQAYTYQELYNLTAHLASELQATLVSPNKVVGIGLPRSLDMLIAMLAVVRAGGTLLSLDVNHPASYLADIISRCQVDCLVVNNDTMPLFQDFEVTCLHYKQDPPLTQSIVKNKQSAEDICYIIFTSGSTGRPKGVAIRNNSIVNLVKWHGTIAKDGDTRTLGFSSFNFDVSIQELFSTVCNGGTYYLASDDIRTNPARLADFILEHQIERMFMPYTPLLYFLQDALVSEKYLTSLNSIITAGEKLIVNDVIREFFTRHKHCKLRNQYGMTEVITITDHVLSGEPESWPEYPVIGQTIPNTQVHLLNDDMQAVSPGDVGELYVGGICVAAGFVGDEKGYKERFLDDPFSSSAGKLYRTGDFAQQLQNGELQYISRKDSQVKIRGNTINLVEIETVLRSCKGVGGVYLCLQERGMIKQLMCYLERAGRQYTSIFEIKSYLATKLPEYMIPNIFVFVDKFPVTSNGKLDHKALAASGNLYIDAEVSEPENETHSEILKIWQTILKIDRIGIDNNFFNLGGDSILAAKLLNQLEKSLNLQITLQDVYSNPTIRSFYTFMEQTCRPLLQQDEEVLSQLLDEIEQLSPDQIQQELGND